jgi:hypothetical protein
MVTVHSGTAAILIIVGCTISESLFLVWLPFKTDWGHWWPFCTLILPKKLRVATFKLNWSHIIGTY